MNLPDIDTPAVLIDLDIVEANLTRAQAYADQHGFTLRPHIKTHKSPLFAGKQIALGARGITCQKLGEAEIMADAGIDDILLTYNILGAAKLARLAALHQRITLSVVADSQQVVRGYAKAAQDPAHPLSVLIEVDTGAGRCGVQTQEHSVTLARAIAAAPGLDFAGLMTYPPVDRIDEVRTQLADHCAALEATGLPARVVSNGGTPDFRNAGQVSPATEHRPGTYIFNDLMQIGFGHATLADCAMTVLATVVSRPTPDRAVIDAGSKALAADLSQAKGHGHVVEYPDAVIHTLNEEHGIIDLSACAERPRIGDKISVIPNHACVVTNLFDVLYLMRQGVVEEVLPVVARGKVN